MRCECAKKVGEPITNQIYCSAFPREACAIEQIRSGVRSERFSSLSLRIPRNTARKVGELRGLM